MKKVNISSLKAKLSEYLKLVGKGEIVQVLDRKRPVAYLTPISEGEKMEISPSKTSFNKALKSMPCLSNAIKLKKDVVDILAEDRSRR